MGRTSAPQPSATAHPTATKSEFWWRHRSSDWQKRLGSTAKPGWSPRKERSLSPFLGASRVAIRPISRFLFQLRIACHASMVLQVSVDVEIDMRVQTRTLPTQRELEPGRR